MVESASLQKVCVHQSDRCVCRACRLEKCLQVGMDPNSVQTPRIGYERRTNRAPKQKSVVKVASDSEDDCEENVPTFSSAEATVPRKMLKQKSECDAADGDGYIEHLMEKYRAMHERRRYLYGSSVETFFNKAAVPYATLSDLVRPASGEGKKDRTKESRFELMLLCEWVNDIPGFAALPYEDKVTMFRLYLGLHWSVERSFISKKLGHEKNLWLLPDLSFINMHMLDFIKNMVPGAEAVRLMAPIWERCKAELCEPMHKMGFDDADFVGLCAILLWNTGKRKNISLETKVIAAKELEKAMNALFSRYQKRYADPAERFGGVLLLTPTVYSLCIQSSENFHLMRTFDVFKVDKKLEDVILG
uniref:Uncharacterized protein n=1 Tax=Plectus sambesii TaxID=2011161 RepID=A0A914XBF2_9BILA